MRNLVFLLALSLCTTVTVAQKKEKLKSYEVKNLKPWERYLTNTTTAFIINKKDLKGPEYKNYKPWKNKSKSTKMKISTSNKSKLMGPEYKNYKPWKNKN